MSDQPSPEVIAASAVVEPAPVQEQPVVEPESAVTPDAPAPVDETEVTVAPDATYVPLPVADVVDTEPENVDAPLLDTRSAEAVLKVRDNIVTDGPGTGGFA